jgi:hypothetical protein
MDLFDELLREFSSHLGLSLHKDNFGACCLQIGEKLRVHIAPDKKDHIVIFAFLEDVGPGKFREEVLKEGLKANNLLLSGGVLGYSGKNGFLSLHQLLPVDIGSAKLFESFLTFIDYAVQWQTALAQGKTSPLTLTPKSSAPSPLGLKP